MMEKPFEIVPANVSKSDIRAESNRRSCKAGYCDHDGQPLDRPKIRSGRTTEQYRNNYRRAFGHD